MGELRLFTPGELAERSKPKRQRKREEKERIIEQFRSQLKNASPGYGGEIQLDDGEDKRKTRSLLREAANRSGLYLRFRPIKDRQRIEFLVVKEQDLPRRRRGRARGKRRTA